MEESGVARKLLGVKLAQNVGLGVRFKAGVVEKEPMTVVVAIEDMVRFFRNHTSPGCFVSTGSFLFPTTVMIHSSCETVSHTKIHVRMMDSRH